MTTEDLVARVKVGDVEAFGLLVMRYQRMAFAYALATLHDYHLAEDATQQALVTAYCTLGTLREPGRFGGWLRGIVRFECLRLLRDSARQRTSSLDAQQIAEPIDSTVDVEQQAEVSIEYQRVLALMAQLPERQRVVAQLYYLGDRSQGQVAEFLGLSVSTVNNRLREARASLRWEGAHIMTTTTTSMPTPDFSEIVGTVIRTSGLTIDTRFKDGYRPALLTSVKVGEAERAVAAFVAQYLDDEAVRLVTTAVDTVVRGAPVRGRGQMTDAKLVGDEIARLVEMNRGADEPSAISSGIKVIDVFAPLVEGGVIALVGAMNVGKMVLVEELATRLSRARQCATILVFLRSPDELGMVHQLDYRHDGNVAVVAVPVADASLGALASSLDRVDAVLSMSLGLGQEKMYPAIDPLASHSVAVGMSDVAERARELLRGEDVDGRATRLRAYLTQPFFVAEPYTNRAGAVVDAAVAEADIARLLDGEASGLDGDALLMGGSLGELLSRDQS